MSSRLSARTSYPGYSDAHHSENQHFETIEFGQYDNNRDSYASQYRHQEDVQQHGSGCQRTYSDRSSHQDHHENQAGHRSQDYYERRGSYQTSHESERVERSQDFEHCKRYDHPKYCLPTRDEVEELRDVEDLIALISHKNTRHLSSQIEKTLLNSMDLLNWMEKRDWEDVCQAMVHAALAQRKPEFIADLMITFIENSIFTAVMSEELCAVASTHIMEENEEPVPYLLASILCAHWPRQYATKSNPILFTTVGLIKGWIDVVKGETERFIKNMKTEKVIEEPFMINKCARALVDLCLAAQRQLLVKWPKLTKKIDKYLKGAITHNKTITEDIRKLLSFILKPIKSWMELGC